MTPALEKIKQEIGFTHPDLTAVCRGIQTLKVKKIAIAALCRRD
jgi:hypothetical protein